MKKIIAFGYVNLSDHWASLFYFDQLYKEGFEIIYLNIDPISIRQYEKIVNDSTYLKQIIINDIQEFENIVKSEKNEAIFIPCVTIVPQVWILFRILLKENADTCYIHVGEFFSSGSVHNVSNIKRRIKKLFSKALIDKFIFRSQVKTFVSNLTIAFVAGNIAKKFHSENGCKNIININVRDYEDAVETMSCEERLLPEKYFLFLDGYLPFHHDNESAGFFIEPVGYFGSINRFFDYIEAKSKLKVVIAAHPKSEYEKIGNKFNGRQMIKGKTVPLMKDAEGVLTHESLVSFYALIFKKPMIFLTNNNIDRDTGSYGGDIRMYADLVGCQLVNVDNEKEFTTIDIFDIKINEQKSDNYKYKYLTSKKSENLKSGEIIMSEMGKCFQ